MNKIKRFVISNAFWKMEKRWYYSTYIWDRMCCKYIPQDLDYPFIKLNVHPPSNILNTEITFIPDVDLTMKECLLKGLNSDHNNYENLLSDYCGITYPIEGWEENHYLYKNISK